MPETPATIALKTPPTIAALDPALAEAWPPLLSAGQIEKLIIRAINAGLLTEVSAEIIELGSRSIDPNGLSLAQSAKSACQEISAHCLVIKKHMTDRLAAAGVIVTETEDGPLTKQYHSFGIAIDLQDLDRALTAANKEGYFSWDLPRASILHLAKHTLSGVTLVNTDDVATRMILNWNQNLDEQGWTHRLHPSKVDFDLIKLPSPLWPLYYLIKPYRVLVNRLLGWHPNKDLGPFIGTPDALLPGLLDFAEVTDQDTVIDMGCGDGRIIIKAAQERECQGLGLEKNHNLATLARERVRSASLEHLVTIKEEDAAQCDLSGATVVFLFLPVDKLPELVAAILPKLQAGARLVAHEQSPIRAELTPEQSRPLITNAGITVAHRWVAK